MLVIASVMADVVVQQQGFNQNYPFNFMDKLKRIVVLSTPNLVQPIKLGQNILPIGC